MAWSGRRVQRLLALVIAEHGDRCALCLGEHGPVILDRDDPAYSKLGPSVEHKLPRSRGGSDDPSNLTLAHRRCNSARGNRDRPTVPPEDGRAWFAREAAELVEGTRKWGHPGPPPPPPTSVRGILS